MTKKNAFIGPLPPPLGGVAMMNKSFQKLKIDGFDNIIFNTSNNNLNEDLYKGIPWANIKKEFKKAKELKQFIKKENPIVANIFVTSGYSILRDLYYIYILHKKRVPVIIHFHSKKEGEYALRPFR